MKVLKLPVIFDLPELSPKNILLLPVVLFTPVLGEMNVLREPLLLRPEYVPIKTFLFAR